MGVRFHQWVNRWTAEEAERRARVLGWLVDNWMGWLDVFGWTMVNIG